MEKGNRYTKKRKNPLVVPCILLTGVSMVSVIAAVGLAGSNATLREQVESMSSVPDMSAYAYSETEAATTTTEATTAETETESVTEAPETAVVNEVFSTPVTDSNTIYIYDNGDERVEYPEIAGAVLNDIDMDLVKTDEKKHKTLYDSEGNKISRFGIDVSSYQGEINWAKVAADGVEFAILRCAYRGYESGKIVEDKYFRWNAQQAQANGIDVGVYFFSQAITPEEAAEEAAYTIDLLKSANVNVTMPVVFDWEFSADEDAARTDDLEGNIQLECCKAFCSKVSEAGYQPMYYSNIKTALFRYDIGKLSDIPLWLADYYAVTTWAYDYKMWQYSCSGVVEGIESFVDFDVYVTK